MLAAELETFQNDPEKSEKKERKTNPLRRNTILSNVYIYIYIKRAQL